MLTRLSNQHTLMALSGVLAHSIGLRPFANVAGAPSKRMKPASHHQSVSDWCHFTDIVNLHHCLLQHTPYGHNPDSPQDQHLMYYCRHEAHPRRPPRHSPLNWPLRLPARRKLQAGPPADQHARAPRRLVYRLFRDGEPGGQQGAGAVQSCIGASIMLRASYISISR